MSDSQLRKHAHAALKGVGDSLMQFKEWSGYAFHLRRRLTMAEEAIVGDAIDCRGSEEGIRRFEAIRPLLQAEHVAFALKELNGRL